jgi:hypothetical protein
LPDQDSVGALLAAPSFSRIALWIAALAAT